MDALGLRLANHAHLRALDYIFCEQSHTSLLTFRYRNICRWLAWASEGTRYASQFENAANVFGVDSDWHSQPMDCCGLWRYVRFQKWISGRHQISIFNRTASAIPIMFGFYCHTEFVKSSVATRMNRVLRIGISVLSS